MLNKVWTIVLARLRVDLVFVALVAGVVLINVPYFSPAFFPQHDTMSFFEIFYSFYNQYFFHGTIAQWVPYGVYGVPAAVYQVGQISPAGYLVCFIGKLFMFKDVLVLFKVAMLLDQLFFLTGMYWLCRFLFTRTSTVIVVCLASFCSFEWISQLVWNFKIYDLLPWALYGIILFFEKRRAAFFWLAGITGVVWAYGTWCYMGVLWIFLATLIGGMLFMQHPRAWKDLWPKDLRDGVVMGGFVILAVTYLCFLKGAFDAVALVNRPPEGANALQTFLTYGEIPRWDDLVVWIMLGVPVHPSLGADVDNTAYVSIAGGVFFLWAVMFVRHKYFLAVLAAVVALVWLSLGGLWATMVYHFPGMKYFRHIGLVLPLIKVLIALGAGFGLQDLWSCPGAVKVRRLLTVLLVWFLLVDMTSLSRHAMDLLFSEEVWQKIFAQKDLGQFVVRMSVYYVAAGLWLVALFLVAVVCKVKRMAWPTKGLEIVFSGLLIMALAVDVASFQKELFCAAPVLPAKAQVGMYAVNVNALPFVEKRTSVPQTQRQADALSLEKGTSLAKYDTVFSFTQMDICNIELQPAIITSAMKRWIDAKTPGGIEYDRVLGCEQPKLRIVGGERLFSDQESLEAHMRTALQSDEVVYLAPEGQTPRVTSAQKGVSTGDVRVTSFSANELRASADVRQKGGAWLVYADAWHPGWKAYVDGAAVRIEQTYIAFKAVFVPEGRHEIRFTFSYGLIHILSYVLAFIGLAAGVVFSGFVLLTLLGRKR